MEKERNIACQLSYLPVNSADLTREVEEVLSIIKSYFPECEVGELSTVVKGSRTLVFQMVDDLFQKMDSRGNKFNIQMSLSNICGCPIN